MKPAWTVFLVLMVFHDGAKAVGAEIEKVALSPESLTQAEASRTGMCLQETGRCYQEIPGFARLQIKGSDGSGRDPVSAVIPKVIDPNTERILRSYEDFAIESLDVDSDGQFVARLSFDCLGSKQMGLVFGNFMQSRKVAVTGYADLDPNALKCRERAAALDNIANPYRNFQYVPEQVRRSDWDRVRAVGSVLQAWALLTGVAQ